MYDLRIDGRAFVDMKLTTLADMRSRGRAEGREAAAVWSRGGAVAGVPAEAPTKAWGSSESGGGNYGYDAGGGAHGGDSDFDRVARGATPSVPSISMTDFVGAPAETNKGGGGWEPFSGEAVPAADGGAGDDGFGAPAAPAPVAAAPPVPARGLAKPAAAVPRHPQAPSASFDPFEGATSSPAPVSARSAPGSGRPSPAAGVTSSSSSSLANDFAGLSFGGPAAGGAGATASAAPVVDIFASGLPASAAAKPAAATQPGAAAASNDPFGSVLYDLDNLNSKGPAANAGAAAAANKPTLGQLAGGKPPAGGLAPMSAMGGGMAMGGGPKPGVMAVGQASSAGLSGLDALFGAPLPVAGGMPMGYPPQQQQQPMGMGGMGMGYGGGMGMQPQQPRSAPAPAPSSADYNPFA